MPITSPSLDPNANYVSDDPIVEQIVETMQRRQELQLDLEAHTVETVDRTASDQLRVLEVVEKTHALVENRLGQMGIQSSQSDPYWESRGVGPDVLPLMALGNYIPRGTLQRGIRGRLLSQDGSLATLTALHGTEGAGKTMLALHTIHSDPVRRHYQERRFWFHGSDDPDQLDSQFHQLAVNLRLVEPTALGEHSVDRVLAHFNSLNKRYFMVFDHAGTPESLRRYLPERGGEILVTTQNGEWPDGIEIETVAPNRRPSFTTATVETPLSQLLDHARALEEAVNQSDLSEAEKYCTVFGRLGRQYVGSAVLNETYAKPLPIGESLVRSLGSSVIQHEKDLQLQLARACRLFLELSCMKCHQEKLKVYKKTTVALIDELSGVKSICRKEDVALRVELECALDAARAMETFDPDVEGLANLLVNQDVVLGLQLVRHLSSRITSKTFVDLLVFSWLGSLQGQGLDQFKELIQAPLRKNRELETFGVTGGHVLANLVWNGNPEVQVAALEELCGLASHRRMLGSTWSIRYIATQHLGALLSHPKPKVVSAASKALFDRRIREDHSDICALLDRYEKNPVLTDHWAQQFHLDHSLWEEEHLADESQLEAHAEEVARHTNVVREKEIEMQHCELEEQRIQREKADLVGREAALLEKEAELDCKLQRQDELLDALQSLLGSPKEEMKQTSNEQELQKLLAAIEAEKEALAAAKEKFHAHENTVRQEEERVLANKHEMARQLDEKRGALETSRQRLNVCRRKQILQTVRLDTMKQRYGGARRGSRQPDVRTIFRDRPDDKPAHPVHQASRVRPTPPPKPVGLGPFHSPTLVQPVPSEQVESEGNRTSPTRFELHKEMRKALRPPSEPLSQLPLETLMEYATLGDPEAQNLLGEIYWQGELVSSPDYRRAFHWFKEAADLKHLRALCNLGQCYYLGRGISKDAKKALEIFREAASRNDPEANYRVGLCYFLGEGTALNLPEAFKYLSVAAYQDDHLAQRVMGMAYAEGESRGWGISADPVESRKWYDLALPEIEKRAYRGDPECQALLGVTYLRGFGRAQDFTQAYTWIELAAQRAYPLGEHMLGFCFEHGKGVAADGSEAIRWYKRGAEHGYALSQATLATHYETGKLVPRDLAEAVRLHREAALQGLPRSQLALGLCYKKGSGVSQSYQEAIHWTALAAQQQYGQAEYALGWYYEEGKGVSHSDEEAVKWYRRATSHNSHAAELRLSECLAIGKGVEQDVQSAISHCQSLADKGYPRGQFALGQYYFYGDGVKTDQKKAAKLFAGAAKEGLPEAQVAIGHCYREGKGTNKDLGIAATYYQLAADQGHSEGEVYTGWCYEFGIGVPQSWTQAHQSYLAAAQKGNGLAQNQLGLCYQYGKGLAKSDPEAAKRWFEQAVENGHKEAEDNLLALELMQADPSEDVLEHLE